MEAPGRHNAQMSHQDSGPSLLITPCSSLQTLAPPPCRFFGGARHTLVVFRSIAGTDFKRRSLSYDGPLNDNVPCAWTNLPLPGVPLKLPQGGFSNVNLVPSRSVDAVNVVGPEPS